MDKYKGISEKTLKNGTKAIYVRFKYLGKIYPVKNFTKLFGCTSKSQAYEKLKEVRISLSKGIDPFNTQGNKLNDYFYKRLDSKNRSGEWKENTINQYRDFYEKHIKKPIGHLKLDKIKYEHLEKILDEIIHTKGSYRNRVSRILSPLFQESIKRGEIINNPCDFIDFVEVKEKEKLSKRVFDDRLTIARTLYKAFKEHKARYSIHKDEINVFFLMVLLTGHRYGEILQLKRENCYLEENLIISPEEITKTKKEYEFPLPKECREWIATKSKKELLFPNINYDSVYYQFQNILKTTNLKIRENKKFSPHDLRSIMLNVMRKDCKIDTLLADYCLEHKIPSTLKHYIDFDYDDKKKAFKKYWKKIRN
ncbi:tyrosine-type recombinase/integrase [Arcobacter sp. CECT 8985]|uniref:tyrosine-type recombinase/integrase n=1 Tax=Arcobacter sp. CECT 8985 TaxID=1935424 RepID=UPI00100BF49E|nr:tyrosine-type recombinase/integrase [Arcobacter sp. CECT 8985]RXJ87476.1 hypothetical protein CRU93_03975 [Arcobacter sp. CECT 8985]